MKVLYVGFCLLLWILQITRGYFVSMATKGRVVVLATGDNVLFNCAFSLDGYNLFDFPVFWTKVQRSEQTRVNVMGVINEPFASTDRFQVNMEVKQNGAGNVYNVVLEIINTTLEDSGNYTCEIFAPGSIVLANVTHYLFIKTPVQALFLSRKADLPSLAVLQNLSITHSSHHHHHLHHHSSMPMRRLKLAELAANHVVCLAVGGYPPPTLLVFMARRAKPPHSDSLGHMTSSSTFHSFESYENMTSSQLREYQFPPKLELPHEPLRDVTSSFANFNQSSRDSGSPGLRKLTYRSERWTDGLKVGVEEDEAVLGCTTIVPGIEPLSTYVLLDVDYSPKLWCQDSDASYGERNVFVKCFVKSKPRTFAMFWILDQFGTLLADSEVKDGLWTVSVERDKNEQEVKLFIKQVGWDHFRKYTLVAENVVSISTHEVFLRERSQATNVHSFHIATASHVFHHHQQKNSSRDLERILARRNFQHPSRLRSRTSLLRSSSSSPSLLSLVVVMVTRCLKL